MWNQMCKFLEEYRKVVLSLMLYNLCSEIVQKHYEVICIGDKTINYTCIYFADDTTLVAESTEDWQVNESIRKLVFKLMLSINLKKL